MNAVMLAAEVVFTDEDLFNWIGIGVFVLVLVGILSSKFG